jgi:hypothetical protein
MDFMSFKKQLTEHFSRVSIKIGQSEKDLMYGSYRFSG